WHHARPAFDETETPDEPAPSRRDSAEPDPRASAAQETPDKKTTDEGTAPGTDASPTAPEPAAGEPGTRKPAAGEPRTGGSENDQNPAGGDPA
ncbi:hypothetical protein K6I33_006560, partial [Streptomyces sp. UNOB3_S3]|nr:hypothetical protein [Streptomyces sp. UNOB3_S3]